MQAHTSIPQPHIHRNFGRCGWTAISVSLVLSTLGLFGIGAAITLLTGRSVWFSGMRQVIIGLSAAGITFLIGRLIGASVGG